MSYGTDRLAKLGITTSEFSVDAQGNIVIHYTDIYGQPIPCLCENPHIAKQLKALEGRSTIGSGDTIEYLEKQRYYKGTYTRIRIAYPKTGCPKYLSPSKEVSGISSLPFYPLEVVQAYANCDTVPSLYLTEGELKAKVACLHGIPTIAFAGISLYAMTEQLRSFLVRCQVENVYINYDEDCTDNAGRKERAYAFFASACKLIQALYNAVPNLGVYLSVTKGAKGLDDLILEKPQAAPFLCQESINDYVELVKLGVYTHTLELQQYFGLERIKKGKYPQGYKADTLLNHAQTPKTSGGRATNLKDLL